MIFYELGVDQIVNLFKKVSDDCLYFVTFHLLVEGMVSYLEEVHVVAEQRAF